MRVASLSVWLVALFVAGLIAFAGTHFSVRSLRALTVFIVLALLVVVTAYGQTPPSGHGPQDLESAFALGADRLSAAFFRPLWMLWSARQAAAPGRLGWVVIGVVLLLGYRQSEAWAISRQAPVLDTSRLADGQPSTAMSGTPDYAVGARSTAVLPTRTMTESERHDWLAAELKFRLAAVEVHAPPILPSGSRSEGLASIAESSGVGGGGLAAAVIRFFAALWPAPRRYELRIWVEPRSPDDAGPGQVGSGDTRVTVELDDPASGSTVASKTVVVGKAEDAASLAAGYVARQIFVRDRDTPPWCYGASDGRDLGALLLARQERTYVETAEDIRRSRGEQIAVLWRVTGLERCAGVVRYELAQLEDLERRQLTALRLHALNREQYPRFFRGTYRLCMSLEMVGDEDYDFLNPAAVRAILDDVLDLLYRTGVTPVDRCGPGDIYYRFGESGPSVLSHALRETLLAASAHELRVIRRQLAFPVVAWNTFFRREERTVWKPHWHLASRQGFRDGVLVAELLVAVKRRLNEHAVAVTETPDRTRPGLVERLRQREGMRIAAAIVGDAAPVKALLWARPGAWPVPREGDEQAQDRRIFGQPTARPASRDRVRRLPWQTRTASWQAAYNTACLYAVLARHGLAGEEEVIASLRRVTGNRESGLERPHDWISNDPDFAPLLRDGAPFPKFQAFMTAQLRRDYPAGQSTGLLPVAAGGKPPQP